MSLVDLLAKHHGLAERLRRQRARSPELAEMLDENVRTVAELRRAAEAARPFGGRLADGITRFSGSLPFLYFHAVWFGGWVGVNVGAPPVLGFDPYPFGLLTMIVSLEAIFLSTFVLISQSKMAEASDRRADLDLQINLLAEHEVTRLLRIVRAMAEKMGVEEPDGGEELGDDAAPRPPDGA